MRTFAVPRSIWTDPMPAPKTGPGKSASQLTPRRSMHRTMGRTTSSNQLVRYLRQIHLPVGIPPANSSSSHAGGWSVTKRPPSKATPAHGASRQSRPRRSARLSKPFNRASPLSCPHRIAFTGINHDIGGFESRDCSSRRTPALEPCIASPSARNGTSEHRLPVTTSVRTGELHRASLPGGRKMGSRHEKRIGMAFRIPGIQRSILIAVRPVPVPESPLLATKTFNVLRRLIAAA
jgi:hypothetical protein